jgi:hypothetical protein
MKSHNPHIYSTFDHYLEKELLTEANEIVIEIVITWQI